MAIWDQVKARTQTVNDQLKTKAAQFRGKEFAEGSMAMCALIASADGTVDAAERRRTATLITTNDLLAAFEPDDLRTTFDRWCDKLVRDPDFGKVEAVAAVAKLKAKPDQARAVISIGLVIGAADGTFDAAERAVVREACFAVGIAPAEFDL